MALMDRFTALINRELAAGRAVPTNLGLEDESSAMVHEELARLDFALNELEFHGKSVLDLGCGTGYAARYIAEIVGVDLSVASIQFAKEHYPRHTFLCLDASELDLTREFDIVMTFEVIEHVPDPARFLATAARHLADSGVLALSTPNRLLFSLGREKSIVNKTHIHEFIEGELRDLLEAFFSEVSICGQRHRTEAMQEGFFADVLREEKKQLREERFCRLLRLNPPSLEDRPFLRYPVRGVLNIPRWYHMVFDPTERNVHRRTRNDFAFETRLDEAIWFMCFCRGKK